MTPFKYRYTHTHTHTHITHRENGRERGRETCAALCAVVDIPNWTIAAFHGSDRVYAFTLAVAAAVVFKALVYV